MSSSVRGRGWNQTPWVGAAGDPDGGFLLAWGHHRESGWWGFVYWTVRVMLEYHTLIACAGWVAGDRLRPDDRLDYSAVPRQHLPDDPGQWPELPFGTGPHRKHYYGRTTGEPLPLPFGATPL
jgi:hypothetical protein